MGLYNKNLRNTDDLKQEIAALKRDIQLSGWPSPLIPPANTNATTDKSEPTATKNESAKHAQQNSIQSLLGSFDLSLPKILSAAAPVLLSPSTIQWVLGLWSRKKNKAQATEASSGLFENALGMIAPVLSGLKSSKSKNMIAQVLGGYAKWAALSWAVGSAYQFLQKENKKRNNPARKALRKLEREQKQLIRAARKHKKHLKAKA